MIDAIFNRCCLSSQGRAALEGLRPIFWSKLDASVALAFALIESGEGNADRIADEISGLTLLPFPLPVRNGPAGK
jgi:hypothetical protein